MISDCKKGDNDTNEDIRNVSDFPDSFSESLSQDSTCHVRNIPRSCMYSESSHIVLWILGLSDSSTGMISWRILLRSYVISIFELSSRYSITFSILYCIISDFVVESNGLNIYPEIQFIPDIPRTLAHFMIFPMIVSVWSTAWCAVRIHRDPYRSRIVSRNTYRSRLAIASIFIFSVFAIDPISIFWYSNLILYLLHIFATSSLSQFDSTPRSEWSKCATMTCDQECCPRIRSNNTILSTHPLTASTMISSGLMYFWKVVIKDCIGYLCCVLSFLTNPKKSSSGATILSISLWHFVHRCRIISHLFFL